MNGETLSGATFFIKRVLPVAWLGFLLIFMVIGLVSGPHEMVDALPFLLMPLIMAASGVFIFRKLVWDLADDVSLAGDALIVRKGGIEERIRLAEIMNVSVTQMTNPTRISLRLRKKCRLGDEVVFMPKSEFRFNPFARNMVGEKLILLVDRARQMDASR
ncbi:MAG: hypothetical protein HOP03_01325 [Lysobacter sp.]|nr:hypothetical protein [Lysobacter sp.]